MGNKNQAHKSPTTFEQQVEILKRRNLIIDDHKEAIEILKRVNYYRLSAYMLTYKVNDYFIDGVAFRDIYDLYEFDKRLRNISISILETVEIAFRTHIAYLLAHNYGATCYLDPTNFQNPKLHVNSNGKVDRYGNRKVDHPGTGKR